MLLTPPDVISQVLLAFPVWLLFEAGLIASRIIFKDREFEKDDDYEDDDSDSVVPNDNHSDNLRDDEMESELDQAESEESKLDKSWLLAGSVTPTYQNLILSKLWFIQRFLNISFYRYVFRKPQLPPGFWHK